MINPNQFLTQYWQKQPQYFNKGFANKLDYLPSKQLLDLSLKDEIESRIVFGCNERNDWHLEQGPFLESFMDRLKLEDHYSNAKPNSLSENKPWTLLVQSVDSWFPPTQEIINDFNFIPNWRFDDLMVSYATNKGGVGPHVDNYDVFLVQASGKRRWRVGAMGDVPALTQANSCLPLVEEFECVIDVIMEPGDVLYIPPNTAHWGESIGESIGYSVGYRSPQMDSILSSIAETIELSTTESSQLNPFFTDQYRNAPNRSNRLEEELLNWVQKQLLELANKPDVLKTAIGKQLSYSKFDLTEPGNRIELSRLTVNSILQLNSGFKANWAKLDDQILLNIEGESWQFANNSIKAIEKLASYQAIPIKLFNFSTDPIDFPESFTSLINTGYINLLNEQ